MNTTILTIIQNYINTVEGLFDRDPAQLSLEEYGEYLSAITKLKEQGIHAHASREKQIEDYLYYEVAGV